MGMYYVLDENKNAVECTLEEASKFLVDLDSRRVAESYVGEYRISTAFMVINSNSVDYDPPILFGTFVFTIDEGEKLKQKYSTWKEAEEGHYQMVCRVEKILNITMPTIRKLKI